MKKILVIIMIMWLGGCTSFQPIMTEDVGIVVDQGEYWVEVMYKVINKHNGAKAMNLYHKEHGHRYEVGDWYPDNSKEIISYF